jgi:hypothetical protein
MDEERLQEIMDLIEIWATCTANSQQESYIRGIIIDLMNYLQGDDIENPLNSIIFS